jgi:Predicted membrane protein (DUF2207) C-terminal domain
MATSSSSEGFSLPVLVAAGAVALAWLGAAGAVWVARRPPDADEGPTTMELGPEPPAIAALLCGKYEVRTETAPATLLDLAARDVITLDEIQPGETICRLPADSSTTVAPFERHVLAALRTKAIDGVIPATALTTGTADASARWHRQLAQLVVVDAQHRGLTLERWSNAIIRLVGAGVLVVVALLLLAAQLGGDAEDHPTLTAVALVAAVGGAVLLSTITARMKRSLAQRPTPAGSTAEAAWLGVRAHLSENEHLQELPPAAVKLYGRHLAYAAGFGLAGHAVAELPFGQEDDHLAWSPQGGRWRRVRVRYPRIRPPAWGRHPAIAALIALISGTIAVILLVRLAELDRNGSTLVSAGLTVPLLWSVWVLVRAVPDLFSTASVTGTVLRCRTRRQIITSRNEPRLWYYVAIDDGTRDRIAAFRVSEARYRSVRQGQQVTAAISPRLGYVRTLS